MSEENNLVQFIDKIFVDDKIDHQQLKEFLKLIPSLVQNPAFAVPEESKKTFVGPSEVQHLSELIGKCEERLAKLAETPKTRIVIRNEGEKLQSIIDSVEHIRMSNCSLRAKIDELSAARKPIQKAKCDIQQAHPNAVDQYSDICNLRRMYFCIQNQVDELSVKCHSMENSIKELQEQIPLTDRVPTLEEQLDTLLNWRESLREEFNFLAERYEHVKTVKAGKMEVQELLENKVSYCHLSNYVQRDTFNKEQQNFTNELKELKDFFCELQLSFSARLVALQKDVQMVLSRLATKRRPH